MTNPFKPVLITIAILSLGSVAFAEKRSEQLNKYRKIFDYGVCVGQQLAQQGVTSNNSSPEYLKSTKHDVMKTCKEQILAKPSASPSPTPSATPNASSTATPVEVQTN